MAKLLIVKLYNATSLPLSFDCLQLMVTKRVCDAADDQTWRTVMYGQWVGNINEDMKMYASLKETTTCSPKAQPQSTCLVEILCNQSCSEKTQKVVDAARSVFTDTLSDSVPIITIYAPICNSKM